ncbi:hypothetical protein [Kineococcus sp. SYSU DK001]|uniref:hypothetical protein n=1 Tax=Kineococcus sp. SYSU DK001 TaxID=3383122 RepID=UPI003D7C69A5
MSPNREPVRAVRLTFAYDSSGIRLIDRTPVDKRVPPGEDPGAAPSPDTVSAELRTAADRPTFRVRLSPYDIPQSTEVFDPGTERGVHRVPRAPTRGAFSVIVPDDAAAQDVVLLAGPSVAAGPGPADATARTSGPQEIGRYRLREDGGDGNG